MSFFTQSLMVSQKWEIRDFSILSSAYTQSCMRVFLNSQEHVKALQISRVFAPPVNDASSWCNIKQLLLIVFYNCPRETAIHKE